MYTFHSLISEFNLETSYASPRNQNLLLKMKTKSIYLEYIHSASIPVGTRDFLGKYFVVGRTLCIAIVIRERRSIVSPLRIYENNYFELHTFFSAKNRVTPFVKKYLPNGWSIECGQESVLLSVKDIDFVWDLDYNRKYMICNFKVLDSGFGQIINHRKREN